MSRGKKLDLSIGADFGSGWSLESEQKALAKILEPNEHSLYISKERRKGKIVLLAGEFFIDSNLQKELLAKLKKRFACGGAFKDGFLELQIDRELELKQEIQNLGYRFKK